MITEPINTAARSRRPRRLARTTAVYLGLVILPVAGALLLLLHHGATAGSGLPGKPAAAPDPVPKLLIALPAILLTCRLSAAVFRRIGQPEVIGEIVAGIVLGPSVLGAIWPGAAAWLFPPFLATTLNVLAQLGLVLFMFLVGHDLDLGLLRGRGAAAVMVSQVSIAVPFASGILLAAAMYGPFARPGVSFPAFALFVAVSMSITAFPVLARLLVDRGLDRTVLGALSLSSAAVNDVAAWCLLAVVVAMSTNGSPLGIGVTLLLLAAFVSLLVFVVRPLLVRLVAALRSGRLDIPRAVLLPALLSAILLSALATQAIGVHAIFGAFLLGAIAPRDCVQLTGAMMPVRGFTVTALLPLFFVYTGLRTKFGLLGADWRAWAWCAVIIAVAVTGKGVGSAVGARAAGIGWRDALSVGALMNCRGLTELVVLSVGLDLGVISPQVFAMLVIMALAATMMTAPALTLIGRWRSPR